MFKSTNTTKHEKIRSLIVIIQIKNNKSHRTPLKKAI